jgi:hypothetical protein
MTDTHDYTTHTPGVWAVKVPQGIGRPLSPDTTIKEPSPEPTDSSENVLPECGTDAREALIQEFADVFGEEDESKPEAGTPTDIPELDYVAADTITPTRVEWLWKNRLPRGRIVILEGDPGVGKSTITTDALARVSIGGTFPDGQAAPKGHGIVLSAEDDEADTIVPRLSAVGADLSQITVLRPGKPDGSPLSIPDDVDVLRRLIGRVGASLLVIDPLSAFLAGRVNDYRDHHIRRALTPLSEVAQDTGCCIIVIRHWTKGTISDKAIHRGAGSIGIAGAARVVMAVGSHPDADGDDPRVLATVKNNLGPHAPSLMFGIEVDDARDVSRIVWGGQTDLSADALMVAKSDEEKTAVDDAVEFLREELKSGPVQQAILKKAWDGSWSTLRRAKSKLNVRSSKAGFGGAGSGWTWSLPTP